MLLWKFAIFLKSFSKLQVSFSWNFGWLFRVMKYSFSVRFYVKRYILCTKGTNQNRTFENFECSGQNSPSSCHIWNNTSVFLRTLHHSSVLWDINPLYFFSWNFIYLKVKSLHMDFFLRVVFLTFRMALISRICYR